MGGAPCSDLSAQPPRLQELGGESGGHQRERQVYTALRFLPEVQSEDGASLRNDFY